MEPGDLVTQNLSKDRPVFASWRFTNTSEARLVGSVACGMPIVILSKSIQNPFIRGKSWRLRHVLTPIGVGYMWEHELELESDDGVEWVAADGNAF